MITCVPFIYRTGVPMSAAASRRSTTAPCTHRYLRGMAVLGLGVGSWAAPKPSMHWVSTELNPGRARAFSEELAGAENRCEINSGCDWCLRGFCVA